MDMVIPYWMSVADPTDPLATGVFTLVFFIVAGVLPGLVMLFFFDRILRAGRRRERPAPLPYCLVPDESFESAHLQR